MPSIDYELRPAYAATFNGGLIQVDDQRDIDVAAALITGAGTITIDATDHALVEALDSYPPLYRTGEDSEAPATFPDDRVAVVRNGEEIGLMNDLGEFESVVTAQAQYHDVVTRRASIDSNSVHNAAGTTGLTISEGTRPLRLLTVLVGDIPGTVELNGALATVGADNGGYALFIQWSPTGAETWNTLGACSETVAGAGGRGSAQRKVEFGQPAGTYDFRVAMQGLTNATIVTLVADGGAAVGKAFLEWRCD